MSAPTVPTSSECEYDTILFAIVGMSPGILTETIWALADEKPPVVPHQIIALTTTAGKQQISKELFTPSPDYGGKTVWKALVQRLSEDGIAVKKRLRFEPNRDIRVITDNAADEPRELDDIRDRAENEAAADFIMSELWTFAGPTDTRIIASVAGGRKTMGALLIAAMSLLGRPQDRLTHVLVNEPFESPGLEPRFFFPAKPPLRHVGRDRAGREVKSALSSEARMLLADVPFVRLRRLLPKELGELPRRMMPLVNRYAEEIERRAAVPEVSLDSVSGNLFLNGKSIRLRGRELPLMAYMLDRASRRLPCFPNHMAAYDDFLKYLNIWSASNPAWTASNWAKQCAINDLKGVLSSCRNRLREAGFPEICDEWFPIKGPDRGRFGIPPELALLRKRS